MRIVINKVGGDGPNRPRPGGSGRARNHRLGKQQMRLAQPTLAAGILACVVALGTLAPPALAADRRVIDEGYTDAFFIDTSGDAPLVQVNHGLQNEKFDPNTISFGIDDTTYGTYEPFAPYLDRGHSGYYTASEEADDYFEPGWSAPAFRENGYSAVRIDFTDVQGPGDVAILGNRLDVRSLRQVPPPDLARGRDPRPRRLPEERAVRGGLRDNRDSRRVVLPRRGNDPPGLRTHACALVLHRLGALLPHGQGRRHEGGRVHRRVRTLHLGLRR